MAEAALPKTGTNATEEAKNEAQWKRGQIRRGRVLPNIKVPAMQEKAMKAMWDYNFGRKSNYYKKPSQNVGDQSEAPSFQLEETDSDSKFSSLSSTDDDADDTDTVHNALWIKEQQARRRRKDYHSPVSMEMTDGNLGALSGKSINDTAGANDTDESILSASEIKKQQALRRRKNYRSPGDESFAFSVDKENVKEVKKEVPMRRDTLEPYREYSAILDGVENTTEQSIKGLDSSKKQATAQKTSTRAMKSANKKKSAVLNAVGLEISEIMNSNSGKKPGTRSSASNIFDEDTENLKALGILGANKAWKEIVTSTPLSVRPPSGAKFGSASNESAVPPAASPLHFDVPEPVLAENEDQNATLTEDDGTEEVNRGQAALGDPVAELTMQGPPEGDVPNDEESAVPEPADGIAALDRSASANDLTITNARDLAQEEPSARSAPPTPTKGRRYPLRARKPKKVCHLCRYE